MGLDCSHEAWHGAYSAFSRWRGKIAEVAGLPPLSLMEGHFSADSPINDPLWSYPKENTSKIEDLYRALPIKWEVLKADPLHRLLHHPDDSGHINARYCGPIANRLEELLPLLPDEDAGGHIGNWREKTQKFIDGLRAATAAHEPLLFR